MYALSYIIPMENYAYYFDLIQGKKQRNAENAPGNGQDSMMQRQNRKDSAEQQSGDGQQFQQGETEKQGQKGQQAHGRHGGDEHRCPPRLRARVQRPAQQRQRHAARNVHQQGQLIHRFLLSRGAAAR
jgi:hypothetical protein